MNRVLLIDDDNTLLEVLDDILSDQGYIVSTCNYTEDIQALVLLNQPDLIVIDYLINGINGGELCSLLKRNSQTSYIPVIIVSAYQNVFNSLGHYGCDAFLSKPFDLFDFLKQIEDLILQSQH